MKKTLILLVAAVVAAITLTASVTASDGAVREGTLSFESAAAPALNFTLPMHRAADIYPLLPANITGICAREYDSVRRKCQTSSNFTHEGVKVRVKPSNGSTVTIELSVSGYKITAADVSWEELDRLFGRV